MATTPATMDGSELDWLGEIEIADRWARWSGLSGDSALHRHFSAQAILAEDPVTVFDAANRSVSGRCVLIPPLVPHRIAQGVRAQLIFVEPPSRPAEVRQMLQPWFLREAVVLGADQPDNYWAGWLHDGATVPDPVDQRVIAVIASLDSKLSDGVVRMPALAAKADLSPDHFRHLFATQIGTPFRRYVLWRRLVRAAEELAAGSRVTDAAHAAGFADAAHFARTLKSTFGIRASQALTNPGLR